MPTAEEFLEQKGEQTAEEFLGAETEKRLVRLYDSPENLSPLTQPLMRVLEKLDPVGRRLSMPGTALGEMYSRLWGGEPRSLTSVLEESLAGGPVGFKQTFEASPGAVRMGEAVAPLQQHLAEPKVVAPQAVSELLFTLAEPEPLMVLGAGARGLQAARRLKRPKAPSLMPWQRQAAGAGLSRGQVLTDPLDELSRDAVFFRQRSLSDVEKTTKAATARIIEHRLGESNVVNEAAKVLGFRPPRMTDRQFLESLSDDQLRVVSTNMLRQAQGIPRLSIAQTGLSGLKTYMRAAGSVFMDWEDDFRIHSRIFRPVGEMAGYWKFPYLEYHQDLIKRLQKVFGKDILGEDSQVRVGQYMLQDRLAAQGKHPPWSPVLSLTPAEERLRQFTAAEFDKLFNARKRAERTLGLEPISKDDFYISIIQGRTGDRLATGRLGPGYKPWYAHEAAVSVAPDVKQNVLEILGIRARTQYKEMYLWPAIKDATEIAKGLPRDLKTYVNHWLSRAWGIPSETDLAWSSRLRKLPFVGRFFKTEEDMRQAIFTMTDLGYMSGLGLRPFAPYRNLYQPLINTAPDIGERWVALGYASSFDPRARAWAKDKGFIQETFLPELYELEGRTKALPPWVRGLTMTMFRWSDEQNRIVTAVAAKAKFDDALQKGRIDNILRSRRGPAQDPIRAALAEGNIEAARDLYIKDVLRTTQYLYLKENSPLLAQQKGAPWKLFTQYRTWFSYYAEMLHDFATTGTGVDKLRRATTWGANAALTYGAMTGSGFSRMAATGSVGLGPLIGGTELSEFNLVPMVLGPVYTGTAGLVSEAWRSVESGEPGEMAGRVSRVLGQAGKGAVTSWVPGGLFAWQTGRALKEAREQYMTPLQFGIRAAGGRRPD